MDAKNVRMNVELKADGQAGQFVATFSTLQTIDKDGDVTMPGAFLDGQPVRISAWGHNWGALPVGKGVIHADEERAWVDGEFFLNTTHGKDTYETVKSLGDLQEWSYGFDVLDWSRGPFDGQEVRFLRGLDVHEVSPVLIGAGVDTRTDRIKSAKDEKRGARNSASDLELMRQMRQTMAGMLDAMDQLMGMNTESSDEETPKEKADEAARSKADEPDANTLAATTLELLELSAP